MSSTEAELYAAVEATKDVVWLRHLLEEIGFPQHHPTKVYVDNESLITLASQFSGNHKRVKHFLVKINFLISMVDDGVVVFEKVDTLLNPADLLTKPLGPREFLPKRQRIVGLQDGI